MTALVLIAKETIPGRVKTRMHPPLSLEQAAELAAAAIADTLDAIAEIGGIRRVLLFDGILRPAGSEQYDVMEQVDGDLDERLGAMFDALDEPTLLIGMDTPQLTAGMLEPAFDSWRSDEPVDAWFGPAEDGGYWSLGLLEPRGDLVRGIPMSTDRTGAAQLDRLRRAGLTVGMLPQLTDVDDIGTARAVASAAPHTRFAATLASFDLAPEPADHTGASR